MNMVKIEPAEPTKEQLAIAELATPLAKYMEDHGMTCGVVLVTMDGVSLYWEGFTADYANNFTIIVPPHTPGLPKPVPMKNCANAAEKIEEVKQC